MSSLPKEKFFVMIADDSVDDRFLMRSAMQRATRLEVMKEVSDGAEAITYFKNCFGKRAGKEWITPDLLLLDLKMPNRDGFEVLRWLRHQEASQLMVVVLTDSMDPSHIRHALELGADLFQVKPDQQHERVAMVLALEQHLMATGVPQMRRALRPATSLGTARDIRAENFAAL